MLLTGRSELGHWCAARPAQPGDPCIDAGCRGAGPAADEKQTGLDGLGNSPLGPNLERPFGNQNQHEPESAGRLLHLTWRGAPDLWRGDHIFFRGRQPQKQVFLIKSYGEGLQGNGAKIGQRQHRIDLHEGLTEGIAAQLNIRCQRRTLDLELIGYGTPAPQDNRRGNELQIVGKFLGKLSPAPREST